eukprot:COSAG01_NODE_6864_length_3464_cov_509.941159_1_plen_90_part_00
MQHTTPRRSATERTGCLCWKRELGTLARRSNGAVCGTGTCDEQAAYDVGYQHWAAASADKRDRVRSHVHHRLATQVAQHGCIILIHGAL